MPAHTVRDRPAQSGCAVGADHEGMPRSRTLSRAEVRPAGHRRRTYRRAAHCAGLAATALLVVSLIAVAPPPATAQSSTQSNEVLIGTFGASREDPRSGPSRRSLEQDAHRLLEDAREDLSAGYVDRARHLLQTIVRRYPDTFAGRDAEAILARIDAGSRPATADPRERPRPDERPAERAGRQGEPRERAAPGARTPPPPRETAESIELRRSQLEGQLRETIGDRIFFANGSADLGAKARQVLAAQSAWLARHPELTIIVEAHADDAGPNEANAEISARRAEAVRQRLVEEGVAADRIRVVAHGRQRRVAVCNDPACSAQNRRVVTSIAAGGVAQQGSQQTRYGFGGRQQ